MDSDSFYPIGIFNFWQQSVSFFNTVLFVGRRIIDVGIPYSFYVVWFFIYSVTCYKFPFRAVGYGGEITVKENGLFSMSRTARFIFVEVIKLLSAFCFDGGFDVVEDFFD